MKFASSMLAVVVVQSDELLQLRVPRTQSISDRVSVKDSLERIQFTTVAYGMSLFAASFELRFLMTLSASLPSPPYGVNTSGEKVPCSS